MASKEKNQRERPYHIAALAKGLAVLELFSECEGSLTLTELAARRGWNKVTSYRFLQTLSDMGYVYQDATTKRYHLATRVLKLGFSYLTSLNIIDVGLSHLRRLSEATEESASMGVLDGLDLVYIARVTPPNKPSVTVPIGSRYPAHCASMGKLLLAFLDDANLKKRLGERRLSKPTPKTIDDPEALSRELSRIRRQGWALSDEEFHVGLYSVAAPIYAGDGKIVAAINIGFSKPHQSNSRSQIIRDFAYRVVRTATDISRDLGFGYR